MLLADSDLGSLLEAQIRVSLSLFVTMTSFMQTVGFAIMPSMKQHLVKNYFWTANYNILSKKHSVFIFSGLFFKVSHQLNLILYSSALVVNTFFNYITVISEKNLGFLFPLFRWCSYCDDDVRHFFTSLYSPSAGCGLWKTVLETCFAFFLLICPKFSS